MSTSLERQMWLEKATTCFRNHFHECGWTVPNNIRVSIGIPKHSGHKKAVGQCWSDANTSDGFFEIFSSPEQGHEKDHLETLAHELVHATVGIKEGHRGLFKTCALSIGFKAPMTSTPADEKMNAVVNNIINSIGYYPAGRLDISKRKKKNTYLMKCVCPSCEYTVRTTQKWLVVGYPICPVDNISMMDGE